MDVAKIQAESRAVSDQVFRELIPVVEDIAVLMADCLKAGGKVMACGNGGSSADAQHFAGELVNRFLMNRRPYAGLALNTDASVMTSISNDFSYEEIYSKQVEGLGRSGDILVGFSTSGNSGNVLKAFEAAKELGIKTVGFLGGSGGKIFPLSDYALLISCSSHTPRIQEGHELMMHLICERVEELMES
ncbi:D-sedoheptulose-7-phosphate isomerase [Pontiella agarivorans]|uniref:Phosphoheptose isomerase n=1 Tax=Pontiella agarivorans TaxID=3038953 RepID=A0ABU5MZA4_9BACT|nr:D-sedoheptulose 7-phosphate isomerase [Pontiella agarivorans]MDZ8119545.1 D-sedoheptulose 7-phosphate isomerase [Pontiella agarivorans]